MKIWIMSGIKKGKINYEQMIVGALLKFKSLDSVDFSLLVMNLKEKLKEEEMNK